MRWSGSFWLPTLTLTLALACGDVDSFDPKSADDADGDKDEPSSEPSPNPDADGGEEPSPSPSPTSTTGAPPCTPPAGIDNDPGSIEAVIALVNALPKPATIKCYLEVLARPLSVNATSSDLSVQPADDVMSPRIFVFSGSLVTAITLGSEGQTLLEMSVLQSNQASLKGELAFPVDAALPADAAYVGVLQSDGTGTRCSACHFGETPAGAPLSDKAYVSRALRPFSYADVPVTDLQQLRATCVDTVDARCDLLRALFDHGDVVPKAFPQDMPTLF